MELPHRGFVVERQRKDRLAALAGWSSLALAALWVLVAGGAFDTYIAGLVAIYAISALGLDWIQGRAGQVSIGSAAFMAVGAYVAATAAEQGFPVLLTLLLAALAGAIVGLFFGLPALRLRGLYLALSTLALQFFTQAGTVYYESASQNYGGFTLPSPAIGPFHFQGRSLVLALVLLLAIVIVGLRNVYKRSPGRVWLAIKESEIAAAVIGIDTRRSKLTAFVGSSALIAFAGGLLAYYTLSVFDSTFSLTFALTFVAIVIIGGLGSIAGVIVGATLLTVAPYFLSSLTARLPPSMPGAHWLGNNVYYINDALYGVLLLVFLLYQPRGIAGALEASGRWAVARLKRRAVSRVAVAATTARHSAPSAVKVGGVSTPGAPEPALLLEVHDLSLAYLSGARALASVSLYVREGEIVALMGRNGAGKTSTLRAISGFFPSDKVRLSGSLLFRNESIRGASPVATARAGLILVPERDKVFHSLTVAEHFKLVKATESHRSESMELFPALARRWASRAGLLSGGERQMLALALARCLQPRLLLVDELSLGLAPGLARRLAASLKEFRDRTKIPILLVEQNVSAALDIADRVYILEAGQIVHEALADEVSREVIVGRVLGQ